jgi:hypothetical protein
MWGRRFRLPIQELGLNIAHRFEHAVFRVLQILLGGGLGSVRHVVC